MSKERVVSMSLFVAKSEKKCGKSFIPLAIGLL